MEVLVIGLLLYGVAFLVFAALSRSRDVPSVETPDQRHAPFTVRRRTRATSSR